MRTGFCILAMIVPALAAAREPVESWGKSGVEYAQYRSDAVECATVGAFRDITGDEPAKRFLRGFRTADDTLNGGDALGIDLNRWNETVRRTQPDRQLRDLQRIQTGDVETCLVERGYARFTLSDEEAKQLRAYPSGSEARHRYLHSLATRPRQQ